MAQNEFKALVFHEIAALHREIAEVRAPKLRKTELDTESTNSGSAASCGGFSSASADDEVSATPLEVWKLCPNFGNFGKNEFPETLADSLETLAEI